MTNPEFPLADIEYRASYAKDREWTLERELEQVRAERKAIDEEYKAALLAQLRKLVEESKQETCNSEATDDNRHDLGLHVECTDNGARVYVRNAPAPKDETVSGKEAFDRIMAAREEAGIAIAEIGTTLPDGTEAIWKLGMVQSEAPEPVKDETVLNKDAIDNLLIKTAKIESEMQDRQAALSQRIEQKCSRVDDMDNRFVGETGPEFMRESANRFEIKTPVGNEPLFKAEAGRIMLNHGVIDFAQIEAATVGTNGPISGMVKLMIPIEGTDQYVLANIHVGSEFLAGSVGISIPAEAFKNPR